jgi:hypothetical protein
MLNLIPRQQVVIQEDIVSNPGDLMYYGIDGTVNIAS